ncbi:MAG: sodium:glutamate symporter [Kiritimatiellae bacterium]|nr:sodium:glutamate symporter [Kiritimatiellia bacterium]
MIAIEVFVLLCIFLVLGKIVRVQIPLLQRLYMPSSVIGGIIGLVTFNVMGKELDPAIVNSMRSLPGFLINIVFATLFLGAAAPKIKEVIKTSFPQLTLAQIVVWGQYSIGIGLCGFLLMPLFNVNPAFGNLLELGFEGGHGTVGGMSEAFVARGWTEGIALGYTVATVGMICGIAVGMLLINWAYSKGYVKTVRPFRKRTRGERLGIVERHERPSAGKQTVMADSIDSLAWHIAIVGIAVLCGFGILQMLKALEIAINPEGTNRLFNGFPMFPLCMIGGVLLQVFAKIFRIDLLIDKGQMTRISGAALDFLAVSAVATIQLSVVMDNWMPLTIMMFAGLMWTVFAVLWFSPRIFQKYWFERGIAEFGQATGVTATGLLLLRTVDPDSKTDAAVSFAGKQLVHEPFMGFWVALAFTLIYQIGWLWVFLISLFALICWIIVALVLQKRKSVES